ncbi:MAG TPA: hypothetical protein PLH03_08280, partial [Methylophilaceae bacterium]|nr:hypothetical protein [Methylophilaceae bacterium]
RHCAVILAWESYAMASTPQRFPDIGNDTFPLGREFGAATGQYSRETVYGQMKGYSHTILQEPPDA